MRVACTCVMERGAGGATGAGRAGGRSSGRGSEEEEEEERRKRMRVTEPERKSDSGEQRRTGKLMARDNEERGKRK